jgi:hypothetical protein
MNLRKLIREGIESVIGPNKIVGLDILNYLTNIPQTRAEVDWVKRPSYLISSLVDGDGSSMVFDKDYVLKYINDFEAKFGERPVFEINGDKINVINPNYRKWADDYVAMKTGIFKREEHPGE